jgi:hypothetical protein
MNKEDFLEWWYGLSPESRSLTLSWIAAILFLFTMIFSGMFFLKAIFVMLVYICGVLSYRKLLSMSQEWDANMRLDLEDLLIAKRKRQERAEAIRRGEVPKTVWKKGANSTRGQILPDADEDARPMDRVKLENIRTAVQNMPVEIEEYEPEYDPEPEPPPPPRVVESPRQDIAPPITTPVEDEILDQFEPDFGQLPSEPADVHDHDEIEEPAPQPPKPPTIKRGPITPPVRSALFATATKPSAPGARKPVEAQPSEAAEMEAEGVFEDFPAPDAEPKTRIHPNSEPLPERKERPKMDVDDLPLPPMEEGIDPFAALESLTDSVAHEPPPPAADAHSAAYDSYAAPPVEEDPLAALEELAFGDEAPPSEPQPPEDQIDPSDMPFNFDLEDIPDEGEGGNGRK